MGEEVRCFVAVDLPGELQEGVAGDVSREVGAGPRLRGVKWVAPAQLHLTLKFLGGIDQGRIPGIAAALDAAASSQPPFTVRLRGAGAFPDPRRPRVVWIGVADGASPLQRLAAAVEGALAPLGFPPEDRPFAPHLTVGRVKAAPPDTGALGRTLARLEGREWGEFPVREVHLVRSRLFPAGAVYSILHRARLAS